MSDFILPVLGLGDENTSPVTVVWRDGTVLCRGILGNLEEAQARYEACKAEHGRKEELRNRDVIVLDDHR